MNHIQTGMSGLENLGATCYLNSLLQMLFHINSFRREVYKLVTPAVPADAPAAATPDFLLALQSTFKNLQESAREVCTRVNI